MTQLWDNRFLEVARLVASWSKDPSTKVGAVVVDDLRIIRGLGYNGFPRGVEDSEDRYSDRDVKYKMVVHAEVNAILTSGNYARGSTLYIWPSFGVPNICNECAKVAIQAGVREIVGHVPDSSDPRASRWLPQIAISKTMLDEAGVIYRTVPPVTGTETLQIIPDLFCWIPIHGSGMSTYNYTSCGEPAVIQDVLLSEADKVCCNSDEIVPGRGGLCAMHAKGYIP